MKKIAASLAALACLSMAIPACSDNILAPVTAEAAKARLRDSDFGYKGLMLGAEVARMKDILGEPLYDKEQTMQGVPLIIYEYPEVRVGVVKATGKVADIDLSGKDYVLRHNVRQGATSYWLEGTYGKNKHQWQGGVPYFIYERPGHPHEHLLFELDSGDWHMVKARITALPLTDEEADRMAIEGADIEEGLEDEALSERFGSKEIDTSALPKEELPRFRMGGKAE